MAYVEVKLKKAVIVADHLYKPGALHVVDEATLAAMGDAVASTSPAPAPLAATPAAATQTAAAAKMAVKAEITTVAGHKPVVEAASTTKTK